MHTLEDLTVQPAAAQSSPLNKPQMIFLCSDSSDTRDSPASEKKDTTAKTEKNDTSFNKESNRFPLSSPQKHFFAELLFVKRAQRVVGQEVHGRVVPELCG